MQFKIREKILLNITKKERIFLVLNSILKTISFRKKLKYFFKKQETIFFIN